MVELFADSNHIVVALFAIDDPCSAVPFLASTNNKLQRPIFHHSTPPLSTSDCYLVDASIQNYNRP
jgi:hypothetical protein